MESETPSAENEAGTDEPPHGPPACGASDTDGRGTNSVTNRLYHGDAAAVSALVPPGAVDLIYADPPFFTGTRRQAPSGRSFSDSRAGGLDAYLAWLRPLLVDFHRLLAPAGTLYLHLDWRAVHYAKVELDRVFGADHFLNEIIWHYGLGGARARSHFLRKHDTLLVYRRGPRATFHVLRGAVTPAMAGKYRHAD